MNIVIEKSNLPNKKFKAVIDNKKTIQFGQAGASDMTQHKNENRKERYIDRHKKNENWNDPKTAGFWSRWLLWNKPTLTESIGDTNSKLENVHIKLSR